VAGRIELSDDLLSELGFSGATASGTTDGNLSSDPFAEVVVATAALLRDHPLPQ
jgi:hypothetical protein